MMRHAPANFGRWLRASDVEPAVELNRIEVHDLAARGFSETKSEFRFSGAGRARDHKKHMRSLMSAGHVRALIFTSEHIPEVLPAVDRARRDGGLADLAAILADDLRRALFQHTG